MTADDFWEKAKPSKQTAESKPRWMTFDDTWVDEVRRGFKACTVFLWFPIYCELNTTEGLKLESEINFNFRAPIQSDDD